MNPPGDHLDQIMTVMQSAFDPVFGEAWTRRQVEDSLLVGNCHYELALANEGCAGFYLARTGYEEVELLLLAVAPEHRRRGIARHLLAELAQSARQRGATRLLLEMRRDNPAGHLYRDFGFNPIGERKDYYKLADGTRADAITLALQLP